MALSNSKELVVWQPPPRLEIVVDTHLTFFLYYDTLKRVLNFDTKFDYDYFMAELGEVVMSIITNDHHYAQNLLTAMGYHRAMLPSDLDTDGLTMMQLRFQELVSDSHHKVKVMRLYDHGGYLPFHFKNWHAGCLLIEYARYRS